jgi:probable rRNA maturation factor
MGLAIDIAVEHEAWHALGDLEVLAARAADAVLAEVAETVIDGAEWSILLADDAFVRDLNARWRGVDRPTNVLSFPTDGAARDHALGDVIVAWETSAREADERGWTVPDYLAHLLVHGLCHLLGLDHDTDASAEAMEAIEARALGRLGIASPFEAVQESEAAA